MQHLAPAINIVYPHQHIARAWTLFHVFLSWTCVFSIAHLPSSIQIYIYIYSIKQCVLCLLPYMIFFEFFSFLKTCDHSTHNLFQRQSSEGYAHILCTKYESRRTGTKICIIQTWICLVVFSPDPSEKIWTSNWIISGEYLVGGFFPRSIMKHMNVKMGGHLPHFFSGWTFKNIFELLPPSDTLIATPKKTSRIHSKMATLTIHLWNLTLGKYSSKHQLSGGMLNFGRVLIDGQHLQDVNPNHFQLGWSGKRA